MQGSQGDKEPRSPQPIHVKGPQAYNRRPSPSVHALARVLDAASVITIFFVLHRLLKLSPVPSAAWLASIAALGAAYWAGFKSTLGLTPGDAAWGLMASRRGLRAPVTAPERVDGGSAARAILLTLAAIGASAWAAGDAVLRQPVWSVAGRLELAPSLPDTASGQWDVLPFYYSLGAWPRVYGGKPVFHSLPYEKGPPSRFPGHIVARWDEPRARVTFEGPKTPEAPEAGASAKGERVTRERIRHCLMNAERSWSCLKIREAVLLRHLGEMQRQLTGQAGGGASPGMQWRLDWFVVRNPAIPEPEHAQGIRLSARNPLANPQPKGQERYVLITENGTHQAIVLDYPLPGPADTPSSPGTLASEQALRTFDLAIRSLRASDSLAPGRAWADRRLQDTKLTGLKELDPRAAGATASELSPEALERVASVQALLLARISVNPSELDSYYHLGGTALQLHRHALKAGGSAVDIGAAAKPLIESVHRFAQDVAPRDPRTIQLQGFWLESKKR